MLKDIRLQFRIDRYNDLLLKQLKLIKEGKVLQSEGLQGKIDRLERKITGEVDARVDRATARVDDLLSESDKALRKYNEALGLDDPITDDEFARLVSGAPRR